MDNGMEETTMVAKREEQGSRYNSRLESELDQHVKERERERQRTINETLDEDNEMVVASVSHYIDRNALFYEVPPSCSTGFLLSLNGKESLSPGSPPSISLIELSSLKCSLVFSRR